MNFKTIFKNIVVLTICIVMVLSVSMPSAFAFSYANNTGTIRFEAEENGVYVDYNGENHAIFVDNGSASAGKAVREQLANWHWNFTAPYTGSYSFEIFVSSGNGNDKGNLAGDASSTFKVGGQQVYQGEILGTLNGTSWTPGDGRLTKLGGSINLTAGVEYKLELKFGGSTCQRVIDYFDIYYTSDEYIYYKPETDIYLNAVEDFDRAAGAGVGYFDSDSTGIATDCLPDDDNIDIWPANGSFGASLYMENTDWFRYTVDIPYAGYYRVLLGLKACTNTAMVVTVNESETQKTVVNRSNAAGNWISNPYPYDNAGLFYFNKGINYVKIGRERISGSGSTSAQLYDLRIVSPDISLYDANGKEVYLSGKGTYKAVIDVTDYYAGVTHNTHSTSYGELYIQWSAEGDATINDICLVAAVYNGTKLVNAYLSNSVDFAPNATNTNLYDYTITVNDIAVGEGETVKLLLWDATDSKPLTDFIEYK